MPIRLKKHYVHELYLDDDASGEPQRVKLHVARLTVEQFSTFDAGMKRLDDPPSLRLLGGRKPDGDEQARVGEATGDPVKDDKRRFVISDDAIQQRRLAELGDAARAEYQKADADDEVWAKRFIQDAIEQYVSVPPGEIVDDDGQEIRTGAELVRFFGGRGDVLKDLLFAIYGENSMSAPLKKIWRSQSAFSGGSSEPSPAAPGPTPAPTAGSAAPVASAISEPATASSDATPRDSRSWSGELATTLN